MREGIRLFNSPRYFQTFFKDNFRFFSSPTSLYLRQHTTPTTSDQIPHHLFRSHRPQVCTPLYTLAPLERNPSVGLRFAWASPRLPRSASAKHAHRHKLPSLACARATHTRAPATTNPHDARAPGPSIYAPQNPLSRNPTQPWFVSLAFLHHARARTHLRNPQPAHPCAQAKSLANPQPNGRRSDLRLGVLACRPLPV